MMGSYSGMEGGKYGSIGAGYRRFVVGNGSSLGGSVDDVPLNRRNGYTPGKIAKEEFETRPATRRRDGEA